VLEYMCHQRLGRSFSTEIQNSLSNKDLSWGELIEQAARHRLLPTLSQYLEEHRLWVHSPKKVREVLNDIRNLARRRMVVFQNYALLIGKALREQEVPFSLRKGLVTQGLLYTNPHLRVFTDLDFLILPNDAPRMRAVLVELGFSIGHFDHSIDAVTPLPREEAIRLRLNPDHMPRFSKRSDDDVVRHIEVDVATSLTWTNSGYEISVSKALESVSPVDSGLLAGLPRLSSDFLFLDSALHLFREAYLEITITQSGEDVSLAKFLEIALLWNHFYSTPSSTNFLKVLLHESDLLSPIGWVGAHTDSLFGTSVVSGLDLGEYIDQDFLNSWRASGGQRRQWRGTMRERLASKVRSQLFL